MIILIPMDQAQVVRVGVSLTGGCRAKMVLANKQQPKVKVRPMEALCTAELKGRARALREVIEFLTALPTPVAAEDPILEVGRSAIRRQVALVEWLYQASQETELDLLLAWRIDDASLTQ